jgi:hypothetical protein
LILSPEVRGVFDGAITSTATPAASHAR